MRGARLFLPPPPRPLAWLSGGVLAGLVLGLAQISWAAGTGLVLPPTLALLLLGATAASVVLVAAPVGFVLRLLGRRLSHSGFVGGMLGPLLVATITAPLSGSASRSGQAACLAGALGTGLVAGFLAARLASRAEQTGRPASAGLVWTGASLLFTASAWWMYEGQASRWRAFLVVSAAASMLGVGFLRRARSDARSPRTRFGVMLLVAVPATAVGVVAPWFAPWVLIDSSLAPTVPWPPSLAVVLLGSDVRAGGDAATNPVLELLSAEALAYEIGPDPEVASLLTLPDATLLAPRLSAGGYATAAILPAGSGLAVGADDVDDRPAGRRMLEDVGWWAGAPLLLGPGSALLSLAGQDRSLRSPEEVAAAAARWLVQWRATRAPDPFFLVVDFRAEGARSDSLVAGVGLLLDRIGELGMFESSLTVVALEEVGPEQRRTRVFIDPPRAWRRSSEKVGSAETSGSELSLALLRLGQGPQGKPWALPGLSESFLVPGRTE